MVDSCHRGDVSVGAVQYRDAVPAILQLPSGLFQVAGELIRVWYRVGQGSKQKRLTVNSIGV